MPLGSPLGGPAGEGCKYASRGVRQRSEPIYPANDFWEIQYSKSAYYSQVLVDRFRIVTFPFHSSKCVFTHGNLQTTNLIVNRNEQGEYHVSGLIDWNRGGFYPEDFECFRMLNCVASDDTSDWDQYLPECISPALYPLRWLSALKWDEFVA